jgi:hypothetical protein
MNKEFIPYEQTLELKELGFDEPCMAAYVLGQFYFKGDNYIYGSKDIPNINAPLYQQAFRWFREKKILGQICPVDAWNKWGFIISVEDLTAPFNVIYSSIYPEYATYEEAELACLKKLIEIVKNK